MVEGSVLVFHKFVLLKTVKLALKLAYDSVIQSWTELYWVDPQ